MTIYIPALFPDAQKKEKIPLTSVSEISSLALSSAWSPIMKTGPVSICPSPRLNFFVNWRRRGPSEKKNCRKIDRLSIHTEYHSFCTPLNFSSTNLSWTAQRPKNEKGRVLKFSKAGWIIRVVYSACTPFSAPKAPRKIAKPWIENTGHIRLDLKNVAATCAHRILDRDRNSSRFVIRLWYTQYKEAGKSNLKVC